MSAKFVLSPYLPTYFLMNQAISFYLPSLLDTYSRYRYLSISLSGQIFSYLSNKDIFLNTAIAGIFAVCDACHFLRLEKEAFSKSAPVLSYLCRLLPVFCSA